MKKSILLSVLLGLTILFSVPKAEGNLKQQVSGLAPVAMLLSVCVFVNCGIEGVYALLHANPEKAEFEANKGMLASVIFAISFIIMTNSRS